MMSAEGPNGDSATATTPPPMYSPPFGPRAVLSTRRSVGPDDSIAGYCLRWSFASAGRLRRAEFVSIFVFSPRDDPPGLASRAMGTILLVRRCIGPDDFIAGRFRASHLR